MKNKKGNSPLWLAANGGHLNVVDLLYHAGADIDSQDNRKVCETSYLINRVTISFTSCVEIIGVLFDGCFSQGAC